MALPTLAQLKAYLKVQTTGQDTLLTDLLARAVARVEAEIGRPITAREGTWTDEAESGRTYGGVRTLLIPVTPVDAATVVVTDGDDATVSTDDYRVDATTGLVRAKGGAIFGTPPYTITANVGLSLRSDYVAVVEPDLSAIIIDVAADLYERRNPAAAFESAGAGVSVTYNESANLDLPSRIKTALARYRLMAV